MAYSKLVITFNVELELLEFVEFVITDHDISVITTIKETCTEVRTGPGEFRYRPDPSDSAASYVSALNYDLNSTNLYTISRVGNAVTIQAKKDNVTFGSFYTTNLSMGSVVTNEPFVSSFYIETVDFSQATADECNNVKVDVTATSEITGITTPVAVTGDGNEDLSFDYVRGTTFTLTVTNGVNTRTTQITTPDFLVTPTVSIVTTPTGANVTILGNTLSGLTYSLDGVTYKSSSVFYGITEGTYTAYVKDMYGCIKTTSFEITGFETSVTPTTPYSFVSNTNTLRFKRDMIWDNTSVFKNEYNTLSHEEDCRLVYPYYQKFLESDSVTTQLKTNYSTVTVTTILSDGTEAPVTAYKKTANIGKKDMRDSLGYEFPDGVRYGIYFQTGNTYDYDTGVANGTYELYGTLPAWAKIGQYFYVDGYGYYQIKSIVYEDAIGSEVLVIDSLAGSPTSKIVSTTYNVFNWDAYEFGTYMDAFLNKCFQVKIVLSDPNYETITFLSEKITVYQELDELLYFKYKNTVNNEILYSTGIEHILRLDYTLFGLASETNIEIHKTDNYVYSLNTDVYSKKKVEFINLSTMMAQKVVQALSLDTIYINGVQYTTESISDVTRMGVTNFYKLEAVLYKTSDEVDTQYTDIITNVDIIEVPALISGGTGFIEI